MVMRIGVVGGGLFGCTTAIYAARAGHDVHLFEKSPCILLGATAHSFNRLHRGYHYPRSLETGRESRAAEPSFRTEFQNAVIDGGRQFYVVPDDEHNHVTPESFREFLAKEGLLFFQDGELFRVVEPRVNVGILRVLLIPKLLEAGVNVHLDCAMPDDARERFDEIVVAAYADSNMVLAALGLPPQTYRYQLVERPVLELPERFKDTSIVAIDGPYGCIDPLDDGPFHILGHVTKLVHAQNEGIAKELPKDHAAFSREAPEAMPTRVWEAIDDLAKLMPGLKGATHICSTYVWRAVLAGQEATDARPSLTERLDGQVIRIFSGKLGTAVACAEKVVQMIAGVETQAAA